MKITRKQITNLLFLVAAGIVLFTPYGVAVKVQLNKLLAFSPSVIDAGERELLKDYDWDLMGTDGSRFNLAESKGEIVVVNLWATWCPPCIAEMPSFQKLYNDYKGKVKFVFATSDKKASVQSFMAENDYDLPVYYELSNTPEKLSSRTIPASYLIDRQGNIVISKKGAADWNSEKVRSTIDDLLSE